jgi:hypothetical protein
MDTTLVALVVLFFAYKVTQTYNEKQEHIEAIKAGLEECVIPERPNQEIWVKDCEKYIKIYTSKKQKEEQDGLRGDKNGVE